MNRIMVKGLTVFICGLALFGLTACGGGGGGGDGPASDKPEMTIMPLPDHPSTLADAAPIMDGQTVTGVIDSPDDVDFFRLPVTEDSRIGATLDAEAGLEIALLDSEGNVLDIAETESIAGVGAVVPGVALRVAVGKAFLYLRVTCGRSLAAANLCRKKAFKLLAKVQAYIGTLGGAIAGIELFGDLPDEVKLTLPLGGTAKAKFTFDLKNFIRREGGGGGRKYLRYTVVSIEAKGLEMTFTPSNEATIAASPGMELGRHKIKFRAVVPGTEGTIKVGTEDVSAALGRTFETVANVIRGSSEENGGMQPGSPPPSSSPPPSAGGSPTHGCLASFTPPPPVLVDLVRTIILATLSQIAVVLLIGKFLNVRELEENLQ